jgi:hypothetical protein
MKYTQYSRKPLYRQCILERKNLTQTTWIPEKFAVEGGFVELKNNEIWENGWKVLAVGQDRLSEEYVNLQSVEYTKHREVTDI